MKQRQNKIVSLPDPNKCDHDWVTINDDYGDGMILQQCAKCGKTRIVDADTQ